MRRNLGTRQVVGYQRSVQDLPRFVVYLGAFTRVLALCIPTYVSLFVSYLDLAITSQSVYATILWIGRQASKLLLTLVFWWSLLFLFHLAHR